MRGSKLEKFTDKFINHHMILVGKCDVTVQRMTWMDARVTEKSNIFLP